MIREESDWVSEVSATGSIRRRRQQAGHSQSSRCSVWTMPNRHDQGVTCIPCCTEN